MPLIRMTTPESPAQPHDPAATPWLRWVLLATILFTVAYLPAYWATPLGQAPQVDAKENLALAEQIASGEVPREPMYRAMLYPWLLSHFLNVGVPPEWMPFVASLFGAFCHIAATVFTALLAARLWSSSRAGLLGGLLYGLNPVAVYFAAIPFDITLGIAFFLGALWFLTSVKRPFPAALTGGTFLALAVMARPHFLPVALLAPLLFRGMRGEWKRFQGAAFAVWIPTVAALLLFGLINRGLSDEFRVLPWQGAFNLYSSNKSGADGRFHVQTLFLTEIEPHENPTRLESELLYGERTGKAPPFSVDEMNAHWRQATLRSVREDFTGWIALKIRKGYFLLNNWEQYNNLTYAYHQRENALLRFNPIGWGVLLLGAVGGIVIAFVRREPWCRGLLLTAAIYAAGVCLFIVSARFRLPLAPLLCVFAAGTVYAVPVIFKSAIPKRVILFCGLVGAAGILTFSRFANVADTATFIQDESLIANAAAELGQDLKACRFASRVLERRPDRSDALRIFLISYFNLRLMDDPGWREFGDWEQHRERLEQVPVDDSVMQFIAGGYRWQFEERDAAVRLWEEAAAAGNGPARAILVLAGRDESRTPDEVHPAIREQLERILETGS